jgi:shikimate kinase
MQIMGNFFFIGLMGAGKSTIGKHLARRLGKTFFDSDREIERRTGVKIPVIFDIEGEAGFRLREEHVIDDLTQKQNIVLATGGGAILSLANRQHLHTRGTVIYLRASIDDLFARTRRDKNRPLLHTPDPKAKLAELYLERDPLYQEIAHVIIDTGRQSVSSLLAQLEPKLPVNPATN